MSDESWPDEIFDVLRQQQVRQVAYVPDAGHKRLIERCGDDPAMRCVPLTTEEEGVALLCGAWFAGERGVLLMQSSGLGNCINMFSLTRNCRTPLLMLVTMRGEYGEFNPWQAPMGQNSEELLKLSGAYVFRFDEPARAGEIVEAAARMAFEGPAMTAALIGQRVIGAKTFGR